MKKYNAETYKKAIQDSLFFVLEDYINILTPIDHQW